MPLVTCRVSLEKFAYSYRVNCFAIGASRLNCLSAVGAGQATRFLAAALRSRQKFPAVQFEGEHWGSIPGYFAVTGAWDIHYAKIGAYDDWHLVALRKNIHREDEGTPGSDAAGSANRPKLFFLPNVTNDSLWAIISSPEFTTPLLREWVSALRSEMLDNGMLRTCDAHLGCDPAVLWLNDNQLDVLVSHGLMKGTLKMERKA